LGKDTAITPEVARRSLDELFRLSESRGKEASGAAFLSGGAIRVAKHPIAASDLITRKEYRDALKRVFAERGNGKGGNGDAGKSSQAIGIMGHSRLVTNGGQQIHDNNQPVVTSGMVGIHNGIITNVDDLWTRFPDLHRRYDIDTEVLLSLIRKIYAERGDLAEAVRGAFRLIEGAASIAVFFEDLNCFLLTTNTGSLYLAEDSNKDAFLFASENYILRTLLSRRFLRPHFDGRSVHQVLPGTGYVLDLDTLEAKPFLLNEPAADGRRPSPVVPALAAPRKIEDISPEKGSKEKIKHIPGEGPYILSPSFVDEYPRNREAISHLRRCTRCILPETMPFIEFDEQGVCNYCHGYRKLEVKGMDVLREAIEPYRGKDGRPDCLVTFSGGRDSSYGVHLTKVVLGMNPVTYTYDWGMVTDLGRRNQMRICGKLGIEHILVSADIARKRSNIRKNVSAWLRKPNLGTVPLFMAGDKQYFYYANKVGRQTGCKIVILCENMLETTRFKSGFCGVAPAHGTSHTYTLSLLQQFRMASHYLREYLTNPAYINSSIVDTVWAYCCYYMIEHNYLNLYKYIPWDEETIASTLIREYNWETANDTKSTWRIGDGTASFYNYIYYTLAGLTENDTFRSNQIREGALAREEAMRLALRDNEPRYESIQWYCDIIGIDFDSTIRTINATPKLYPR
jgi:hypothetical protein